MGTQVLSCVGQHSLFGRQSVFCGLHNVQMQQASMKQETLQTMQTQQASLKTKDTTALKVPGRSLSRVLIEPNPV